jgi:hypothetical protein
MSIKTKYDDGELIGLSINDNDYCLEDDHVIIPIPVLLKQEIKDLPKSCIIEICDNISDRLIVSHNVPITIEKKDDDTVEVIYDETITRKYWDGPIGLKILMETKRDIIIERHNEVGDVNVDYYDDDGAYISLRYSFITQAGSFDELFILIDQIYNEIEGATDIALGSPFEKLESCTKESEFSTKILIPLFRALGFTNVKYNHGNKEYGKDITFARKTEFDELEFYGCQVKFGNVSGDASGEVNELITQAKDAFQMPFYDVYTRQKVRISKLVIAVSGKFTANAIEKIVEGLTDYPLKNNLVFIDGDKITNLLTRYRRF